MGTQERRDDINTEWQGDILPALRREFILSFSIWRPLIAHSHLRWCETDSQKSINMFLGLKAIRLIVCHLTPHAHAYTSHSVWFGWNCCFYSHDRRFNWFWHLQFKTLLARCLKFIPVHVCSSFSFNAHILCEVSLLAQINS